MGEGGSREPPSPKELEQQQGDKSSMSAIKTPCQPFADNPCE